LLKDELETPALLADRSRMIRNIEAMQRLTRKAGVNLRPHAKTHKSADLAKLQIEHGAVGICVQKVGEAEALVSSGIDDIFVTNEIVEASKIRRLVQLLEKARLKVAVDSLENAQMFGETAAATGKIIPVFIEVDCGMKRCGVQPAEAAKLAEKIRQVKAIKLEGIMTYDGHLYHVPPSKRQRAAFEAISKVVGAAREIQESLGGANCVSCGSTPTAETVANIPGVTEIQPGNYIFYDGMQIEIGSAQADQCALSVLATVVSKPTPGRVVVDAGIKAFSFDGCKFPKPIGQRSLRPFEIYEEHLALKGPNKLKVGDKIEFLPYHACTTVNMHDKLLLTEGEEVVGSCPITARGRIL